MRQFFLTLFSVVTIFLVASIGLIAKRGFQEPPPAPKATVTILEGSTVSDINNILVDNEILSGDLLDRSLEGYLFPDTYEFFLGSSLSVVEDKFRQNFDKRIANLISWDVSDEELAEIVTIASLIEKEVPGSEDRRIVAGIIRKRIASGVPLQIDASICYVKSAPCLPITEEDKNIDSLYNTYRYQGIPPGPIANPGSDAIRASINPKDSAYWYYLSDPATGDTIFAKTLDEHNINVVKYLSN
jgi:UPF0755 protein